MSWRAAGVSRLHGTLSADEMMEIVNVRKTDHFRNTSASARLAAKYPHIPCTPTPGGVDAEQM
jgi:hypothetical protein